MSRDVLHLIAFFPDTIERVMNMYVAGVSVEAICQVVMLSPNEVNFIIDHYAPHLDET
jgi:hypothetical protein